MDRLKKQASKANKIQILKQAFKVPFFMEIIITATWGIARKRHRDFVAIKRSF
jgi:hypothetical protein